jgi:DNA-binding CsgD family transcriptional regulator
VPGASALTAAELHLLPLLSTHLSFPEIAADLFLSRHTIKSQANSIYRKLGASARSQAVTRAVNWDCWTADGQFHPIGRMERAPPPDGMGPTASGGTWARR